MSSKSILAIASDTKSSLHRPVLNSLFSNFAYFAPSRLNHSDTTGIDMTSPSISPQGGAGAGLFHSLVGAAPPCRPGQPQTRIGSLVAGVGRGRAVSFSCRGGACECRPQSHQTHTKSWTKRVGTLGTTQGCFILCRGRAPVPARSAPNAHWIVGGRGRHGQGCFILL